MARHRFRCAACGAEFDRRRDHPVAMCKPRIVGVVRDLNAVAERLIARLEEEPCEPSSP